MGKLSETIFCFKTNNKLFEPYNEFIFEKPNSHIC